MNFFPKIDHVKCIKGFKNKFCYEVQIELINEKSFVIDRPSSKEGMIDYMEFIVNQLKHGRTVWVREEDEVSDQKEPIDIFKIQEVDND